MQTRTSIFVVLAHVLFVSLASVAIAQEQKPTDATQARIEDLSWIAGNWAGDAMGGQFEETWNPPKGGAMMGMFKFINDGKVNFYEILTIVPKDESLLLRLKHFSNELVGWEEKEKSVEFPLVSVTDDTVTFDGLTFKKISANEMLITVVTKQKDGSTQELKFECHRVGESNQSTQKEIARVFEVDSVLSKQRDRMSEKNSLETAVRSYVLGLDNIDFGNCPEGFTKAFKKHRDAWDASIKFFEGHDQLRGEMHSVMDEIRKLGPAVVTDLDRCLVPIMDTWKEVQEQAKQHGID